MIRPLNDNSDNEFLKKAGEKQPPLLVEFIDFLMNNKKWWLSPIFVALLLLSLLAVLTHSPAAPFIYSFF